MAEHFIKYYPVDNGDTSLITLSDTTKILVDVNITSDSLDKKTKNKYNVLEDLVEIELNNNATKKPVVDAFILTHPDEDHCRGFKDYFYVGDPNKYSKADQDKHLIFVNELWYTPCIFEMQTNDLNDNANVFKQEAKRRMDLFKSDPSKANTDGNRIRIIGYTDAKELKGLEDIIVTPGNTINNINGCEKSDFSLFIHAPFKELIEEEDPNETSIVFQAKFSTKSKENACLAFWGGDAGWKVWEKILDKSKKEDISWDLFLAPHHCSWSYFNDHSDEGKKQPQESSLEILDKGIGKSPKIIISSKPIEDNDDNPPSYQAKMEYVKKCSEKNIFITATHSQSETPKPIEFRITDSGPQERTTDKSEKASKLAVSNVVKQPKTYGK